MGDKNEILKRYGQYSIELAQQLKDGARLSTDELIYLENHLLIVQLALAMSKHVRPKKPVPVRGV